MGRLGWFFMAVIGLGLTLLIINHDDGRTLGLPNDSFANVLYSGVWAAAIALFFIGSGLKITDMIRQSMIWLVIILALVAGYQYRFDLQDFASRVTSGLVPASPFNTTNANGDAVVNISRSADGHFHIRALVDGEAITFMVDTGASDVVLAFADAEAIGLDVANLNFNRPVSTANGQTFTARARVGLLKIGAIELADQTVYVSQPRDLQTSLLGMAALDRLNGFSVRGDQLQLFP